MKKNRFRPRLPRGIHDIPPEKYETYLWIQDLFRETCKEFGFRIMEPATIEFFETLALKSGPDVAKEIYEFKDKAGRHLGLRFDLTVGLTRYVASNPQLPKPIRLAAFSVQWRYDEPQFGRYRSFYAWDIEIYGGDEIYSATEVILFINDFLSKVGLNNFFIHISDRRFLENVIKQFSPNGDILGIMRALDKWGKIPEDEIIKLIKNSGGENVEDMIHTIFYSENPIDLVEEYGGKTLSEVYAILRDELGLDNVILDPSIVRGLDYYDGLVFEVKVSDVKEVGAIVGGGAFKRLTELMGIDLNAIGAAGGIERLLLVMEKQGLIPLESRMKKIIVIPLSEEFIPFALKVSRDLRRICKATVYSPVMNRPLKGWLKYINKIGADYAIFIGEKEYKQNIITIKDLKTREEKIYDYDPDSLRKLIEEL